MKTLIEILRMCLLVLLILMSVLAIVVGSPLTAIWFMLFALLVKPVNEQ